MKSIYTRRSLLLAALAAPITGARAQDAEIVSTKALNRSFAPVAPNQERTQQRKGFQSKGVGIEPTSPALVAVQVSVSSHSSVTLRAIRFKFDSTEPFDEAAWHQLAILAASVRIQVNSYGSSFLIEGHTCPTGSKDHNTLLSLARAEFIRRYLIDQQIPGSKLLAIGCGEAEAARSGLTPRSAEHQLSHYRKVMVHRIAV